MTILIVALAMAISIAVALWITGLIFPFTGIEQLEIKQVKMIYINDTLKIELVVENTGTREITIEHLYIDGIEPEFNIDNNPIKPGETAKITATLGCDKYMYNKSITIKITTSNGNYYSVTLP